MSKENEVNEINFMYIRKDRLNNALRPFKFTPHIAPNALGSVLVECGHTKVICAASFEEKIPAWMKKSGQTQSGWLSAEYAMLPYANAERKARESSSLKKDARSVEIQRIIGRSLRAVVNLMDLAGTTLWIDCDVLQADGGTRTTSITGAYVAAQLAIKKLLEQGKLKENPFKDQVAAISVGICDGCELLDLNYIEDSQAEVDLNVVMSGQNKFIEIQGTAERNPFSKEQLDHLLQLAQSGIEQIFRLQQDVLNKH